VKNSAKLVDYLPGLIVVFMIGCLAYYIAGLYRVLDPLVVGIILGMFFNLLLGKKASFISNVDILPKVFIPIGIIFYGVNIKFHRLNIIPLTTWVQIVIGVVIVFLIAIPLGKKLSVSRANTLLIGVGTAICGASAIALVTPLIKGKSEDTGMSLLTITFWGILGVLIFPIVQEAISMNSDNYALLCATSLHQTGLVKIASSQISQECLDSAMIIKMARTCMIIPIMYVLSFLKDPENSDRKIKKPIPWFLWGFIAAGLVFSFIPFMRQYVSTVKPVGTLLWTVALTSLGFSVNLKDVMRLRIKARSYLNS